MLSRRQQWRRTRVSSAVRQISDAQTAQVLRRKSLGLEEPQIEEREQSAASAREAQRRRSLGSAQTTPFRSIFPDLGPRSKRRVTWNTTVRFRQIPHVSDLGDEHKLSVWWTPEDFRSFARAELFRLMDNETKCENKTAVAEEQSAAEEDPRSPAEDTPLNGMSHVAPDCEAQDPAPTSGTSADDEDSGRGFTALCTSPEMPGKWSVMLLQQTQSSEALHGVGHDFNDVFVVESSSSDFASSSYISCAT
uniref:Uncharacterized protein n=1 Tax=Rhizochromulina marina TaxID=1034831 RepID=A0A7S2RQP2_9STRA|mmetsp:Transcript_19679/g.57445  ORF Transcript_19679/g.57445 Transcript_19679/m.57445 type:complete len:249 (+) Transcript_19679:160-906(+)